MNRFLVPTALLLAAVVLAYLALAWMTPPEDTAPSADLEAVLAELIERDAEAAAELQARHPALADPALGQQAGPQATRAEVRARQQALDAAAAVLVEARADIEAMQIQLLRDLPAILERHGVEAAAGDEVLATFAERRAQGDSLTLELAEATRASYAAEAALLALLDAEWGAWRRTNEGLVFDDPEAQKHFDDLRAATLETQEERQRLLNALLSHQRRLRAMLREASS